MSERFGRYQLLARVGAGGMAEVFRARLDAPGGAAKILVVKRIRAGAAEDPSFLRRFVDEARIALPLSHDNVTSVFEFGEVDGQYFLAMEHVHGQNYAQVIRRAGEVRGRMPRELAIFVAAEVAKGLAYAHGFHGPEGDHQGVIHLDVSPQNVLVSYDGAVKLTDFGISRAVASWQGAADGGPLLGKASYLAPEQLGGGPVDARADLYALGSVLYESLVGEPPHGRGSDEEVLGRLRAGKITPPSSIDPDLAIFDGVVMRALATAPADRHPSAAALHAELSRLLASLAPGTDAPQLAAWMRQAFVDELRPSARTDHVARQLAAAGFDDRDQHTVRMQDVATVALPGAVEVPAVERRSRWRRRAFASAGATAALAVAGGFGFALRPAPPPTPIVENRAATALVSLHSWPSAKVELDGNLLSGQTPISDLEIAAGDHQLVFTHAELGLRKEIDVRLEPGTTRTVVVTLR